MNVTISSSSSSRSNAPAGKGCATIFLGIFAIAGLVFTVFTAKIGLETIRPYFWEATDCVIESSAIRESPDSSRDNDAQFDVRYTYRFDGRSYTGTRFRMGMASSLDAGSAERAAERYAAGSHAQCHVNSSSPSESTLERGSLWSLLIVLLPLVFVAIGVGGIIALWRTGRARPISSRPISERRRFSGNPIFLRIFGFIFIALGGGLIYVLVIHPTVKEIAAARWTQVPCEITSSRLGVHSGSKSSTYSVEIRYHYDFKGHSHKGTRYNFDTGNSSSRGWREEAVAKFPPGLKTLCYVNPDDPFEAVLSVRPSPDRWFGLIPGVFLIVGLFIFFKAPAMVNRSAPLTGIPTDGLPLLKRDAATGEVELKPASTPLTGFIILLIIALVWNGITWGILLSLPRGEWFPRLFLGLFALIGAALGLGVIYSFLAIFNPRPVLTASAPAVPLGGTLEVRWRFTGNVRRLVRLAITLEGREEVTYRRGTTTTTDKNIFAILPLPDTAEREQIASGSAKISVPRELIHTFAAPNNKIVWTLRVHGDIPKWPDVNAEFPITVLPRETATLFHEQNPPT